MESGLAVDACIDIGKANEDWMSNAIAAHNRDICLV